MVGDGVARMFLAVPLGDEVRHRIAHVLQEGAAGAMPGRVVPPGNWHLTLRFLGDLDPVTRDRIVAGLDEADLGPPFSLRFGGLGAFPRQQRATVLWLGVDRGEHEARALAAAVEEAVVAAGTGPEDRPFRPHLTLSRIRPPQDVRALVARIDDLGVTERVERVVLYRSDLGKGGARYAAIEEFPLA